MNDLTFLLHLNTKDHDIPFSTRPISQSILRLYKFSNPFSVKRYLLF